MEKEIKIIPPEGYKIDEENSTFDCIKFKPITKRWRDDENALIKGYYIAETSHIRDVTQWDFKNIVWNYNTFATEKQAKSALAMARISQIMVNDERFGGVITDEEWEDDYTLKYVLVRCEGKIILSMCTTRYEFLSFHTSDQCDLFLKENEDLIKDYLML